MQKSTNNPPKDFYNKKFEHEVEKKYHKIKYRFKERLEEIPIRYSHCHAPFNMAFGDLNSDGYKDVLVVCPGERIFSLIRK